MMPLTSSPFHSAGLLHAVINKRQQKQRRVFKKAGIGANSSINLTVNSVAEFYMRQISLLIIFHAGDDIDVFATMIVLVCCTAY
jgi:hypothetical protein